MDWKPIPNLTGGSLRDQLTRQVEDRSQMATTADNIASHVKTHGGPSLAEGLATAFSAKLLDDPYFRRDFENHG